VVVVSVVVVSVAVLVVVAHGSLLLLGRDGSGRAEPGAREELYRKK
jgi:hypothetical protein